MKGTPFQGHVVTFIAGLQLGRLPMNTKELLSVPPEVMAKALLNRRILLKEQLPTVIRTLEAEEQNLEPKVSRAVEKHQQANDSVSSLKLIRDSAQKDAGGLLPKVRGFRNELIDSGGMVNLDPEWKKEKLFEELETIEELIQTSALDHKAEKKLLDQRKKLLGKNEKWLQFRRETNPEMAEYIDSRRKMSKLFKTADKSHRDMLKAVEKAQPLHEKKRALLDELREIRRQKDRAKELLHQSDEAISHWERRLKDGFEELGQGFPDLLASRKIVEGGGPSSFAKKESKKKKRIKEKTTPAPRKKGGEEE